MAKIDYQDIYGSRGPELSYKKTDAGKTQKKSISQNQAAAQQAGALSRQVGEMDTDALMALMEKISPNLTVGGAEQMQIARDMMAGKFDPKDVEAHAASRGFETGTAGSQFANFNELRSFGVNQMDYMQKGAELFGAIQDRTASISNMIHGRTTSPLLANSFGSFEQQLALDVGSEQDRLNTLSYNNALRMQPQGGGVAEQDAARMAAIGGMGQVGQPLGPQLVGPLNPVRNVMLAGGQQGYTQFQDRGGPDGVQRGGRHPWDSWSGRGLDITYAPPNDNFSGSWNNPPPVPASPMGPYWDGLRTTKPSPTQYA